MVRDEPNNPQDSGWVFMAGNETQEYMDNPDNMSMYDVNTISNYDMDIIPFLSYPIGTEIERNKQGQLQPIGNVEAPSVTFLPPLEAGHNFITQSWSFTISELMLKRIDNDSLVIWKPGFTMWLNVYSDISEPVSQRIEHIHKIKSDSAYNVIEEQNNDLQKLHYSLDEDNDGQIQRSVNLFGFSETEEIHISIYIDDENDLQEVKQIISTLKYKK